MNREIIPPPAADELDPNWTASTAAADRLSEFRGFAEQGLAVGEAYNQVAQLYTQEVRKLQQAGLPVPTPYEFARERAAARRAQGYKPLYPAPITQPPRGLLSRLLFWR